MEEHREFAKIWFARSPLKDKNHIQQTQRDHFIEFDNIFGVLSLTANPKNYKMWEKYSNNHTGFCVGFDTSKMFKKLGGGGPVNYYNVLPTIYYNDSTEDEYSKQIFSKEIKWDFEEEYRTHKVYPQEATIEDRKIKIPKDCYKEIIFGARQSEIDRQSIISICKREYLNVEFFTQTFNENNEIIINKI